MWAFGAPVTDVKMLNGVPEMTIHDRNPSKAFEWIPLTIDATFNFYQGRWQIFNPMIREVRVMKLCMHRRPAVPMTRISARLVSRQMQHDAHSMLLDCTRLRAVHGVT